MIIWSGYGILVIPIVIICGMISESFIEWLMQDDQYYQTHHLLRAGSLFYTAIILYLTGIYFEKDKKPHTFFFIPIKYWALIIILIGLWSVIREYL